MGVIKSALKRLPQHAELIAERDALVKAHGFVPAGHFYSPIVSIEEAKQDENRIYGEVPRELPGINMNEQGQLSLLEKFEPIYSSIAFPAERTGSHRYHFENPSYSYSDAIFLHCMLRHFQPARVIEVGSGYSSCLMLDTNERYLNAQTRFTFIEPYPALLQSLVRPTDLEENVLIPSRIQDVPIETFKDLEAGDFLFFDSTHVSKTGSDVNFLVFELLPILKSGVHIHIHDIFYPFEYPKEWVYGGRSWNEAYVLRAFLQFNSSFTIELMNSFLEIFHKKRFEDHMPLCLNNGGGSIWLQKN